MSDQPVCGPAPADAHKRLQETVGTWNVACEYWVGEGVPTMKAKAVEVVEALGPYWTVSRFEGGLAEMPINGRGSFGYDPNAKRHVSTWIDAGNPWLYRFEGEWDAEAKTLRLEGGNPDPMTGIMTKFRSEEVVHGPDRRTFTMWYTPPGEPETKLLVYEYSRA